jgi:cobalt-zinc-cadmium efflux system outer membrane protein
MNGMSSPQRRRDAENGKSRGVGHGRSPSFWPPLRLCVSAVNVLVVGCASVELPPAETPYYREQLALARAATPAKVGDEAAVLREATAKLQARAAAETARGADDAEGLIDLASPAAREFAAKLADPKTAETTLATTVLDLDRLAIAVHARNPDVAAARAEVAAATRMYEQATYVEDLRLRYAAFATPSMGGAAFPYPGVVALRGEMIDREVAMAREMSRMRLRDAVVAAAKAYHVSTHHEEELKIRDELLALADRLVAAARTNVASGMAPQAELLEMESERAMAANEREHAVTALARARGELNTLLARDPAAPLLLSPHEHHVPPDEAVAVEPFLALARRWSPEVRVARAQAERAAAAIRMAEAMLLAKPAPGVASRGETPAPNASLAGDVAWLAELRERRASLERAAEEAVRAAERRVLDAHYEMEAQRRMFVTAKKTAEPLAAQAAQERARLYEAGRGEAMDLVAAYKRRLDAAHDVAQSRHDYLAAEAALWSATGARPEVLASGEPK